MPYYEFHDLILKSIKDRLQRDKVISEAPLKSLGRTLKRKGFSTPISNLYPDLQEGDFKGDEYQYLDKSFLSRFLDIIGKKKSDIQE